MQCHGGICIDGVLVGVVVIVGYFGDDGIVVLLMVVMTVVRG